MVIKFRKCFSVSDLPHFEKTTFTARKINKIFRIYPLGFELTQYGKMTIFILWKQIQLSAEQTIHHPSGYSRLHQASYWEYTRNGKIEDIELGW